MRVIYIASTSHSGSSLLSLMLNAHPEMVSVGELIDLNRRLQTRDNTRCSPCNCGAPSLRQCEFWSRVDEVARQTEGRSLEELDVWNYGPSSPNAAVFRSISKVAGKRFIVDSSKRPGRLSHLLQLEDVAVYPIHLIRDPRGQICSMIRKNGGFTKHIFHYELIHARIRRTLKATAHRVVRYEDLVLHPEDTLNKILKPLGLKFDPQQLLWSEQVRHTIAGNKLRWQPDELILDERWKRNLSWIQRFAIQLGTAYFWRRFAKPHRSD